MSRVALPCLVASCSSSFLTTGHRRCQENPWWDCSLVREKPGNSSGDLLSRHWATSGLVSLAWSNWFGRRQRSFVTLWSQDWRRLSKFQDFSTFLCWIYFGGLPQETPLPMRMKGSSNSGILFQFAQSALDQSTYVTIFWFTCTPINIFMNWNWNFIKPQCCGVLKQSVWKTWHCLHNNLSLDTERFPQHGEPQEEQDWLCGCRKNDQRPDWEPQEKSWQEPSQGLHWLLSYRDLKHPGSRVKLLQGYRRR